MDDITKQYINKDFNRCSKYLFPLLYDLTCEFTTNHLIGNLGFKCDLINIYTDDKYRNKKCNRCLYALVKVDDFDHYTFRSFFSKIKFHKYYKEYYNVDKGLIMLVFRLDNKSWKIVEAFKQGKYSDFPEEYIENFRTTKEIVNCLFNVMTKSPLLKKQIENELDVSLNDDAELDDIPYDRDEIFRYSLI